MEANGAALGPVAQQVLDQAEARVAGVAGADGVELDDRPLVARRVAFHPKEAGQAALVLVDEEQVVRPERSERQPEQAEDSDPWPADRQPERARVDVLLLGEPRQLPEGGEIGQTGEADSAAHMASPSDHGSVPAAAMPS